MANSIGIGNRIGSSSGQSWSSFWASLLASPNSDLVQWNSIDAIPTTSSVYLSAIYDADVKQGISSLMTYKGERMTGYRTISKIMIHNMTNTNITNIIFYIWRYDGSTFNRVYMEDITAKIDNVNEVKTITLATPVDVIEGDFTGTFYRKGTTGNVNIAAAVTPITAGLRYKTNLDYDVAPYSFLTLGTNSSNVQPIHCLGQAPMIVGCGDSLMESYNLHTSMVDTARTVVDVAKSWLYKLYASDNRFIYQNCGIGAQTTTQIEARFNRDVVLKKPKIAIINGGINDIGGGAITEATFLSNWTSILDMCKNNSIIPIVWKMMPDSNFNNAQMQTRDAWNTSLTTLFNSYTIKGKQLIDWDALLGEFRAGGDAGNLWNLKAAYDQGDHVHLNEDGQTLLASTVLALFS